MAALHLCVAAKLAGHKTHLGLRGVYNNGIILLSQLLVELSWVRRATVAGRGIVEAIWGVCLWLDVLADLW